MKRVLVYKDRLLKKGVIKSTSYKKIEFMLIRYLKNS